MADIVIAALAAMVVACPAYLLGRAHTPPPDRTTETALRAQLDAAYQTIDALASRADPVRVAGLVASNTDRVLDGAAQIARAMLPEAATPEPSAPLPDDTHLEDDYELDPRGDFDDWTIARDTRVTADERLARAGISPPEEPSIDDWTETP